MPKHHLPEDLANRVRQFLIDNPKKIDILPQVAVLKELFECLFYASMQTEEGQLIQATITFIDPNKILEPSDEENTFDHWRFTEFKKPIPLTVKTLVKLSKAADPWSSSIAVYYDEFDQLNILGLIDQAIHNQSFINHEIDAKPVPAGYFQAAIQGIGLLSVTSGYRMIGVLRQNTMVTNFLDVWKLGQISDLIETKAESFRTNINKFLVNNFPEANIGDYEDLIYNVWRDTISRLLLQIKKYQHGGALLISSHLKGLDIKYPMEYKRLRAAMLRYVKTHIAFVLTSKKLQASRSTILKTDYEEWLAIEFKKKEANNELKGCIRFIASQSCVDGLIILNDDFQANGFGAIINDVTPPSNVYLSNTPRFKNETLIKKNPKDFGTRHQSMMTFCSSNPRSIGIVVSQDGEIRVIAQFNDKLVMWENVKTQKYIKGATFSFKLTPFL